MGRTSGAPDSNAKPSLTAIDSATSNPFAVEGNSATGAIFLEQVDSSGNPINPAITPQVVGIAAASNGDNTVIAAGGAGKSIYVYAWNISFSGTVNAKFTDGAAGTLLNGLMYGIQNAGGGNSVSPPGYLWKGSANTGLVLNLSGAVGVGGSISYWIA